MNQNQIQQLTTHLSQALDQNYDVVNMEAVLAVICALEGTTITKEQLEATRLAKYINQLRRRTKNEHLARRSKSLLKKWREMVGINQTSGDSQPAQSLKPIGSNMSDSSSIAVVVNTFQQHSSQPSSPNSHRVISDLHSNIDSSEHQQQHQQHTNFSSLMSHINIDNSEESNVSRQIKPQRTVDSQRSATFINNEQSSNSVSNLTLANEKLNQASIVIDIVTDSDENDSNTQPVNSQQRPAATESSSLAHPAFYTKPKKLKKDKKRKERDGGRDKPSSFNLKEGGIPQQSKSSSRSNLNHSRMPKTFPTDSEILSLSNSSMSSILSGDAISGNSQNSRLRTTQAADLTFAGRFKSVSQLTASNDDNSVQVNGQLTTCQLQEQPSRLEQPARQIYEDYIINDSSTSCSRLSPYDDLEGKQSQTQLSSSKPHDSNKVDYHDNILSQVPKKRGRKKGSKGVDSVIAKESSLSQQIFFGSGVKKVKTTKELFNDIQSRKLSISFRGDSLPATNKSTNFSTLRGRGDSRSLLTRPTSSCSETSMHSPQTMEAYSTNVSQTGTEKFSNTHEDAGNSDSDTGTSEPSRDSMKSRGINRMHSLESNSNSLQTSLTKNAEAATSTANYNDVTTQLMHLVRSLNSPLNVDDAERLYRAQIVPCTCTILEDAPPSAQNQSNDMDNEGDDANRPKSDVETIRDKKHSEPTSKIENCNAEEAPSSIPQKQKKSIFDLDFDDDDDPLHSILKDCSSIESNLKRTSDNDDGKSSTTVSLLDNNDLKTVSDSIPGEEAINIVLEPQSIYTVVEDPDCIAKQRFDVQTNDVTNFHINILHNLYVPNINGNWNSVDSSVALKSTISEYLETLQSYTVTDGADVVPKYGSLTYDIIGKDLSCLKFTKNWKGAKRFKSFIPPFLGIAKCLPTCRREAKRLKDEAQRLSIVKRDEGIVTNLQEPVKNEIMIRSPSPLRVEVDTHDNNDDQLQIKYSDDGAFVNNNDTLSYNLLKLANNIKDLESVPDANADGDGLNSEPTVCRSATRKGSSDSNCSDSSLQLTQNSINAKLRNQRTLTIPTEQSERNVVERNRKKRRKATRMTSSIDDEHNPKDKPRIKRIKIAINGNVATQRQISHMSSSNNSSDDEDEDEEYGETRSDLSDNEAGYYQKGQTASEDEHEHGSYRSHSTTIDSIAADEDGHLENEYESSDDEYAIVQRPTMGGGNNHIVLTIKKTPSKINSPVNSISAVSPIVNHASVGVAFEDVETATSTNNHYTTNNNNTQHTETEMIVGVVYQQQQPFSLEPKAFSTADLNGFETDKPSNKPSHTCQNNFHRYYRYRHRRHPRCRRPREPNCLNGGTIDITLKHLFNTVSQSTPSMEKPHRKLFFPNELNREDSDGIKMRIVNYSSNSSSNEDESEQEAETHNPSSSVKTEQCQVAFANNYKCKNETDSIADEMKIAGNNDNDDHQEEEDLYLSSSDEAESVGESDEGENDTKLDTQDELPSYNNGMLPSFNSIYTDDHPPNLSASDVKSSEGASLKINQNYDDDGDEVCYNNNNLSVIKSHSLGSAVIPISDGNNEINSVINNENCDPCLNQINQNMSSEPMLLQPAVENRTGIRSVVDDAVSSNPNSDLDTLRIQEFKEWHQVLQLQSYNNEPLIVLPYVVLE